MGRPVSWARLPVAVGRDAIPLRLRHGHRRQGDVGTREGPHGERSPRALSRGDHDPPRRVAPNARRALEAPGGGVLLTVLSPLWPVFQWLWPNGVITTEELGRAMI